jgi:acyl-CoA reductase-like NAD-dependent aldehyde dehydrogenase
VINQNQVYINSQFVDAITAERIDVIDPATSDVIARVPKCRPN